MKENRHMSGVANPLSEVCENSNKLLGFFCLTPHNLYFKHIN